MYPLSESPAWVVNPAAMMGRTGINTHHENNGLVGADVIAIDFSRDWRLSKSGQHQQTQNQHYHDCNKNNFFDFFISLYPVSAD